MKKETTYTFDLTAQVNYGAITEIDITITEDEALKLRDMLIKELVQTGK